MQPGATLMTLPDLLKPPAAPPRLASSAPAFAIMVDDH
jgi:hypothetical protein